MRAIALCCALIAAQTVDLAAQGEDRTPLTLLDVPYISQSELLCGGAAAAMVLRFWGARGISAETFSSLVDRSAAGIRADALVGDLRRRGWTANGLDGDEALVRGELARGRPVLTLIEDRPSVFHYVVVVAWHDRAVVFHDPARGPFVVMSTGEFDRRWRATRRWMAIVVPGEGTKGESLALPAGSVLTGATACEQAIAEAVGYAQSNELDDAERILAAAVACPAAARELAGVRVLQKRWPEAEDLAATALASDEHDAYAWQVLAVSRFVQNDRRGALSAWNQVGEPKLDLVQFDGLTRTRHAVVERLVDAPRDQVLTPGGFIRAERRLALLPSAVSTRLDYVPVSKGLAELRGAVSERPLVPSGALPLAAVAAIAAATRELRLTTGAVFGGGEAVTGAWRFWPHRMRVDAGIRAPAPWGGVWAVDGFTERQSFTTPELPAAEHEGARIGVSNWLTDRVRWTMTGGVDRWAHSVRPHVGTQLQFVARDERLHGLVEVATWPGDDGFGTIAASVRAQSSTSHEGLVLAGAANLQLATSLAPPDIWWAGDTGHARYTLLRAHPLLEDGRLRTDQLGRRLVQMSFEAQRWWAVRTPLRAAAVVFTDLAHTGLRYDAPSRRDLDAGVGLRLAVGGIPGVFSANFGKGLRDGATAFSVTYLR
jgi:hypothetical protein